MARLSCPHCGEPIAANPIGRWYARFACPHCRGKLQFDARTNMIGIAGTLPFFVMMYALVLGHGESARLVALAAGAAWALSLAASYLLRGVTRA
jgi:uncharacterized protein YbaR (Trm112 family)